MSYLHRVSPNKTTSSQIQATYKDGKIVDANTKEPLKAGQIDKGHKAGYEERVMRKCAERVHMSQKDYNRMMQDPRLYQFETSKNNRSHKFESQNYSLQLHNCFEVIRNYKGKNRDKTIDGFEQTPFTFSSKQSQTKSNSKGKTVTPLSSRGKSSSSKTVTPLNNSTSNSLDNQISQIISNTQNHNNAESTLSNLLAKAEASKQPVTTSKSNSKFGKANIGHMSLGLQGHTGALSGSSISTGFGKGGNNGSHGSASGNGGIGGHGNSGGHGGSGGHDGGSGGHGGSYGHGGH